VSNLLHLPGRGVRAVFVELSERDDSRFMIPLLLGEMEDLQWRRVRPGGDLEQPPLPIPWIVLIDDRHPGQQVRAALMLAHCGGSFRMLFRSLSTRPSRTPAYTSTWWRKG
jgi:hypothetical protein